MNSLPKINFLKRLILTFDEYFAAHRELEIDRPFNAYFSDTKNPYNYFATRDILINGINVKTRGTITTIAYNTCTVQHTPGTTVTGGTSSETAVILKDDYRSSTTSGTLYVYNESGSGWIPGEALTDTENGASRYVSRSSANTSDWSKFKLTKNKRDALSNDYISARLFASLAEGYYKLPIPIILRYRDELNFNWVSPNTETYYVYMTGYYLNKIPDQLPIRPFLYTTEMDISNLATIAAATKTITIYNKFFMHKIHNIQTACLGTSSSLTARESRNLQLETVKMPDKEGKVKRHTILDDRLEYLGNGTYPWDLFYEFDRGESLQLSLRGQCDCTVKPNTFYFLISGGVNEGAK